MTAKHRPGRHFRGEGGGPGRKSEQLGWRLDFPNSTRNPRSARRQYLAGRLHRCGPRPILEALIAVEAGQDLDFVLADFARLQPEVYAAVDADKLPFVTGLSDDFLAGRYGRR